MTGLTDGRADRRAERAAARRAKDRRGAGDRAPSPRVVVLGGLAALILTSPGWPTVRDTFFVWDVFTDSFPDILKAFWLDVKIFWSSRSPSCRSGSAVALRAHHVRRRRCSRCG